MILLAIALWDKDTYEIPGSLLAAALVWKVIFMMLFPKYGVSVLDGLLGSCLLAAPCFFYRFVWTEHEERKRLVTEIFRLLFVAGFYLGLKGNFLNLFFSSLLGILMCAADENKENSIWSGTCGINGLLSLLWRSADPVVCTHMVKEKENVTVLQVCSFAVLTVRKYRLEGRIREGYVRKIYRN